MPPKPIPPPKNKNPPKQSGTPLTKAEINAAKKEAEIRQTVINQNLLSLSNDIGTAEIVQQKMKNESNKLEEQVLTDISSSVQIVSDITNRHISAQREYEQRMSRLKERISGLKSQLADANAELAELKKEKKKVLFEKDSVIENQKREMKEMAYQFSDMLMKTLITITEDFENQTGDLSRDDSSGLPHQERLKDFHLDRIHV